MSVFDQVPYCIRGTGSRVDEYLVSHKILRRPIDEDVRHAGLLFGHEIVMIVTRWCNYDSVHTVA